MSDIQDPNEVVTNGVLNKTLNEAVDTILKGMDNLLKEERKFNTQTFATKEDLNREIGWVRNDIKDLTADLSITVSKREFNELKTKVDKILVD